MSRAPARLAGIGAQAALGLLFLYGLISLSGLASRWGVSAPALGVIALWCGVAALGLPLLRGAPSLRRFAVLAALTGIIRAMLALLSAGRTSTGDPNAYLQLAKGLLADGRLGIYDPFFGGYWRALFPPFYPLVLAGWGAAAGFTTESVLALGTSIDLVTAWLLYRLGVRLGSAGAGRGAAWLYLIWPSVLFSAPLAEKEGLCTALILVLALAWTAAGTSGRRTATIGIAGGLLALAQPGEAPLAALFGLALIGQAGFWATISTGLRAACVAVAVMMPWWIRNWLLFGVFIPLTSAGGASLWIGNNPDATGSWMPPPEQLHDIPEIAYSKRIGAIAVEWIKAHPAAFVRLTLTKLARACGIGVFGVTRLAAMQPALAAMLTAALWPWAQVAHMAMLGVAAMKVRWRDPPPALLLLIAACGVQLVMFGAWFEFSERHREFLTPFLLLLICWGLAPPPREAVGNAAPTP